jgi:hypothetical protein
MSDHRHTDHIRSEERTISRSRPLRLAVGAGITVLLMMLLSQISCEILGLCAVVVPDLPLLTFWEVMSVLTILLFIGLSTRLLRRHAIREKSDPRSAAMATIPATHTSPVSFLADEIGVATRRASSNGIAATSSRGSGSSRWGSLRERMTEEERRRLRRYMEEKGFPGVTASARLSPPDARAPYPATDVSASLSAPSAGDVPPAN